MQGGVAGWGSQGGRTRKHVWKQGDGFHCQPSGSRPPAPHAAPAAPPRVPSGACCCLGQTCLQNDRPLHETLLPCTCPPTQPRQSHLEPTCRAAMRTGSGCCACTESRSSCCSAVAVSPAAPLQGRQGRAKGMVRERAATRGASARQATHPLVASNQHHPLAAAASMPPVAPALRGGTKPKRT